MRETDFNRIVEAAMSRRGFIGAGFAFGAMAFVTGACAPSSNAASVGGDRFGFSPVAANSLDTVSVPEGYEWRVLASWGDPLWSDGAPFDHATRGDAASTQRAVGDNNDGMALFTHRGRTILAVNNEYANGPIIFDNRILGVPITTDDIRKGKFASGVTICEIERRSGIWKIVMDSAYNRRITPETPMAITGPARGHALLKTAADPHGVATLGTWANCGCGRTPWETYLTCEENFDFYFSSSDWFSDATADLNRYGVNWRDRGYRWADEDERFDIAKHPNEANRVGYVVEIDPLDPASTPKKRTALGRFKHENAEIAIASDGRVVVYMGDDERGEFLYKFISQNRYVEDGDNSALLDSGMLYAAIFHDDARGEWVALTPSSTGMASQAEICIHTRQAASAVGATTMDRPEWVAAHPRKAEIYCALTHNKNRGKKPNAGGDATPVGGPNPRAANQYGQIVRWTPDNGDHAATGFEWDLFVLAGNPTVHADAKAGSRNVTPENMFNSPDGLTFDANGLLWIRTDGSESNTGDFAGMGNNQMLVGDPNTGEIRRFMVGPRECEVTGLCWSADRSTMFVGIQHPGAKGGGHFPGGGETAPRSSIVAITRNDGGLVG
ncbi:MAG: PhoX family phosphatase [Rhodospirillaceae bacterium]|jgi:uncharacterized protein|nr:PhoX family phosphatase [Rhodospirillaceae bacterium]MBT5812072.1 PhoX family phosphatase [Rhodospirillaceae bacterium]